MTRMELIDIFASEALGPIIFHFQGEEAGHEATIARRCYSVASAMMAERRTLQDGYHSPARVKARNLRAMAPELLDAVRICVTAEKERQRKLKPGSPASTYAGQRIERLEALIVKAMAG